MHAIKVLLDRGYSVVTTVRNQAKADIISEAFPKHSADKLSFVFVPDVGRPGAFDEAADLIDPAVVGTTKILQAIKAGSPLVNRVVITGSFVSMLDMSKGLWCGHTYEEADWNPITVEQALGSPAGGYAARKTFAEKAAWDFLSDKSPGFTMSIILPPLVFGLVLQRLNSLDFLSESNQVIRSFINGSMEKLIPTIEYPIFADVRDVALCHVRAMEEPEAGNKRFFVASGHYSNRDIIEIIRKRSTKHRHDLPSEHLSGGDMPNAVFAINTQCSVDILGTKCRTLEECIADAIESFVAVESRDTY
ncbi:ketoreductase [Colletotrichum godetiae]|uniref:Ketoreductase n=1 Tax=Colletotrichum godetiae TaxID=1209918 RepID=A0AAJ0ABR9_9PEZI|nr:ketoreductase [Colletotrichum godetiae]KAK1670995.1 ketoreductase [Colletotrichum godetiae]